MSHGISKPRPWATCERRMRERMVAANMPENEIHDVIGIAAAYVTACDRRMTTMEARYKHWTDTAQATRTLLANCINQCLDRAKRGRNVFWPKGFTGELSDSIFGALKNTANNREQRDIIDTARAARDAELAGDEAVFLAALKDEVTAEIERLSVLGQDLSHADMMIIDATVESTLRRLRTPIEQAVEPEEACDVAF